MSCLSVSMFGELHITRDGRLLKGLEGRKAQELLCFLLLHRGHTYPREVMAELLWGDRTSVQSKRNLRQTLWRLQSALGQNAKRSDPQILRVGQESVQIGVDADIQLDVAAFEAAYCHVQGVPGVQCDGSSAHLMREAVALYRGELLEGWYEDWCIDERERLQTIYLTMLDKLMVYCQAHQEYESALAYGTEILRRDRARECTHRSMMRLYYLAGDRAAALRQYERCVNALRKELGVAPARHTTRLRDQIDADALDEYSDESNGLASQDVVGPALPGLLLSLRHLWTTLTNMRQEVHLQIQAVEQALHDQS